MRFNRVEAQQPKAQIFVKGQAVTESVAFRVIDKAQMKASTDWNAQTACK